MKIDKNSYGTVVLVYLFSAAVIFCSFYFVNDIIVQSFVTPLVLAFAIWQTLFHMVPRRAINGSATTVTSVCDGRVVIAERIYEKEYMKSECFMISIYMDFWDVHANFWPVDGKVTYYKYYPGHHHLAFKPKASDYNEHGCTGLVTPDGHQIFFKQIAGTFARRIVCYAKPGLEVKAGHQCGIIKFGSRVDFFLPLEAEIKVKIGDVVRASETVIAEL